MKEIIKNMIIKAEENQDYELAQFAYNLMFELSMTYNAPSNWRDIGEELAEEFENNHWITENCKLYDFI